MNPILITRRFEKRKGGQCGSMLLELLIAIVVLAIGMGGLLALLVSAMYTNNRSGTDSSSMMMAEHVIEQISSQPATSSTALAITDCAGTSWSVSTAGAANGAGSSGSHGGNGAQLASSGAVDWTVDWTQSYGSVPNGYKMQYVACGTGGRQITYDIRWNVVNLNTTNNSSRMILVSARPSSAPTVGGLRYIVPANLRTIGGVQ
jgi:Tfp pilus assembly protein PilV